ncbi:putative Heat shock protein DnaJ, cysteine-rich domain superfamily [Helianthus annuus]|nr:putative Heat shock protein DnaJ, cysteine-rich domain superfamily [Helianthus annuus]
MEQQPLLTEKGEIRDAESEKWHTYPSVGRTGSSMMPTASEVSVDEIRSAATGSDRYPASLHAPLISSPEPPPYISEQPYSYEAGYGGQFGKPEHQPARQILDEVEIRELLIDHVGHRCCWGSRPARTWKIHSIEDCNVYVGTLETFVEEREVITETEPYNGGNIDGKDKGHELGVWELDLRSEFPVLFTNHKESRAKIPHSETVEKCSDCAGRGDIVCATCNPDGVHKENQMAQCAACYGRGLIAHRDGSDTLEDTLCNLWISWLVKCLKCLGSGSLLTRKIAVVKWDTHATRKLNATSGAASVPDDVFHRAKGVQLCNTQAYQCTPAFFADSFFLNQFSSEVISERPVIPPTARVICERHTISVIPVTRVTMVNRGQAFSFYIVGFSRDVYLKDYYPSRFCWGCCPCLDWLKL